MVVLFSINTTAQLEESANENPALNASDCPREVPLNLFNIGNSIGEGSAAYDDIGETHHEAVWSTGFDRGDEVYTLNERFEDLDSARFYENNNDRDDYINLAIEGDEMEDFVAQAIDLVGAASATPSGKVGMVTVFLGNNDVCRDDVGKNDRPDSF